MAAVNIEGFVSAEQGSKLVFQNPGRWNKAEATGPMVVGTYLGLTEADAFGKQNHKFLATRDGVSISSDGEEIPFTAGSTVIINTSSNLASKLADVSEGTEIAVVYNGQVKISKGPYKNKMAHSYSILHKAE